jgi:hypothetical protein
MTIYGVYIHDYVVLAPTLTTGPVPAGGYYILRFRGMKIYFSQGRFYFFPTITSPFTFQGSSI